MNRILRTNIKGLACAVLLTTIAAFLAWGWSATNGDGLELPSLRHLLGTLPSGADVVTALAKGTVRSVIAGLLVAGPALFIAYWIGGIWALREGRPSGTAVAIATLGFLGPTPLLLSLAVLGVFPMAVQGELWTLLIAMITVAWPPLALRIRHEVATLRKEAWVHEARRDGASDAGLLRHEMLPVLAPVLTGLFVVSAIGAVGMESTVGFIGAGVMHVDDSLGRMLKIAGDAMSDTPEKQRQGLVILAGVAFVLGSLTGGMLLIQRWFDDRRVTMSLTPPGPMVGVPTSTPGWNIAVAHRSTGLQIANAHIPREPGITVLAGPSGSGKTLLARAFAGELPSTLRATVRGPRVNVRLLPQGLQENFAPHLPIDRYLRAAGHLEHQGDSLLQRVGLTREQMKNTNGTWKCADELSGGMAQRLGLGLVLSHGVPDVLILDEPVSAIDGAVADRIGSTLRNLVAAHPHLCIIVVNHRAAWTRRYADHIVFLAAGSTQECGPVEKFFARDPASVSSEPVRAYLEAIRSFANRLPQLAAPADADAIVRVSDVTLAYPLSREPVVSALSFAVSRGEIVGLVAPSGGGKSTVLRMLSGDLSVSAGTVLRPRFERIRYCSQNPALALNPKKTLRKILALAATRRNLVEHPSHVGKIVEQAAELARFPVASLCKRPCELSGGLRARAGLALALLGKPALLLADEVTAGLDPEAAMSLLGSLRRLSRRGVAVVMTAHEQAHLNAVQARFIHLHAQDVTRPGLGIRLAIRSDQVSSHDERGPDLSVVVRPNY